MPLLRAFWDAALDVASERAGAIDDGRRVGYRHDSDLAELWEAHDLADVTAGELWVKASYASLDDLFDPFTAAPELTLVAGLVRGEQAQLPGVATTEQLLTNGCSPLYGNDPGLLLQELRRAQFLLERCDVTS